MGVLLDCELHFSHFNICFLQVNITKLWLDITTMGAHESRR